MSKRHARHVVCFSFLLLGAACGGAPPKPATRTTVVMEELRVTPGGAYDAESLFTEAYELRAKGDCRGAVARYDRVPAEFPRSTYASPALYNAALCLMETGAGDEAIPRFEKLVAHYPASRDVRDARFQLAVLYTTVGRHEEGLRIADAVLAEPDPSPVDRMEALSLRAHALHGLGRTAEAESAARVALGFYREKHEEEGLHTPVPAARAHFVLGETLRLRSEAIAIPAGTAEEQHMVLESRAKLLLDAQTEYFLAVQQGDPRWSSAAGYQIGALYDHLWDTITRAPVPPPKRKYTAEAMRAYEDEYRKEMARQIRPLVRHAIRYWELTLMMIERTRVDTEWTAKVQAGLDAARARLAALDAETEDAANAPAHAPAPGGAVGPAPASTPSAKPSGGPAEAVAAPAGGP